ncbi:MAG: pyruvate dehydrogenase complex dihydrolipoamide acetyltransferase [Sandaracinaceae bacterium]
MARIVGLPKLSPTMEEGTLTRWVKQEGDAVEVDDLVAEVETDKATMEWRAFDPGVLLKILVEEGETLVPDAPVAIFGQEGEDISDLLAEVESGAAAGTGGAGETGGGADLGPGDDRGSGADQGSGAATTEGDRPGHDTAKPDRPAGGRDGGAPAAAAGPGRAVGASTRPGDGRVLASPLVRRVAREQAVDLRELEGSGPGGRIIKRDLDAYLESGRARPEEPPVPSAGQRLPPRVEKLSSMRRTIARRLTESKQTIPHFYLTIDADVGALLDGRQAINAQLADEGEKVSVNDLILKAVATALRRVPEVNASFAGDAVHLHQVVDLSMAVAIPDGLLTPVLRDADRKGLRQISAESRDLAARARERKLAPEEMQGGTFSVSNLGMYGVTDFAAVINPGEGAILAVGATREEPVLEDGALAVRRRMQLTLSCDHRVIDGALGARWLQALQQILQEPLLMLL